MSSHEAGVWIIGLVIGIPCLSLTILGVTDMIVNSEEKIPDCIKCGSPWDGEHCDHE